MTGCQRGRQFWTICLAVQTSNDHDLRMTLFAIIGGIVHPFFAFLSIFVLRVTIDEWFKLVHVSNGNKIGQSHVLVSLTQSDLSGFPVERLIYTYVCIQRILMERNVRMLDYPTVERTK